MFVHNKHGHVEFLTALVSSGIFLSAKGNVFHLVYCNKLIVTQLAFFPMAFDPPWMIPSELARRVTSFLFFEKLAVMP